jgi:hypothetical protein
MLLFYMWTKRIENWEKVVNQRQDQAYRIVKELVTNYDNIVMEDLKRKTKI